MRRTIVSAGPHPIFLHRELTATTRLHPGERHSSAAILRLRDTFSFEVHRASGCGPLPSVDMTVSRRSLMGSWLALWLSRERYA